MSNTVSQPIALRLKEAGWEGETDSYYLIADDGDVWIKTKDELKKVCAGWPGVVYPCPNISEIRERMTWFDFENYWLSVEEPKPKAETFEYWLYTVTASADSLAEVWLWKEGK